MRNFQFYFLAIISFTLLLSACRSAQKYTERGDYDAAIEFCINKLEGKKNKKTEFVQGLELAFRKAQERDLNEVSRLTADGRGELWASIHRIHTRMADRQRKIQPLIPLRSKDGYNAQFNMLDVATMERESRAKAADYLYTKAQQKIARAEYGDRLAARDAYRDLQELERNYYRDYRDKNQLLARARSLGTTHILFEVKNQTGRVLPAGFNDQILAFSTSDLDSEWKMYHFDQDNNTEFDYKIVFRLSNIDLSPERVHEREYVDEKTIQDGWDYVLDQKGNVKKDSLGNDIKVKRMAKVRARVLEIHQSKAARLIARVDMVDFKTGQLLDSDEVSTEILFENYASTFTGDERALSNDSKCRIGNRPLPFPMDSDMLVQAAERIKPDLRSAIRSSRSIL